MIFLKKKTLNILKVLTLHVFSKAVLWPHALWNIAFPWLESETSRGFLSVYLLVWLHARSDFTGHGRVSCHYVKKTSRSAEVPGGFKMFLAPPDCAHPPQNPNKPDVHTLTLCEMVRTSECTSRCLGLEWILNEAAFVWLQAWKGADETLPKPAVGSLYWVCTQIQFGFLIWSLELIVVSQVMKSYLFVVNIRCICCYCYNINKKAV